jgi:hypothetical protein
VDLAGLIRDQKHVFFSLLSGSPHSGINLFGISINFLGGENDPHQNGVMRREKLLRKIVFKGILRLFCEKGVL